jgi:hypothetical protein
MNEFKFTCPKCQQNIQATPEYSGSQINCPACQTPLVVPPAPGAPAPAPASPKLSKTASTVHVPATSPAMVNQFLVTHKKPRIGLYVGLGVGALVIAAGIYFGPTAYDKIKANHEAKVQAEIAATNPPPALPPELTAAEILKKSGAAYKAMTSFTADGQTTATIDLSQISPTKKPQTFSASLSVLLSRPSYYRMDWERESAGKTAKGAVWSAGQGDFLRSGATSTKMKNRDAAMSTASSLSGTLGIFTANLFFDDPDSLAVALKNPVRTNDETLNGEKCYVVSGRIDSQNVLFWISRTNFTVAQVELLLGGKVDDATLGNLTVAQKAQVMAMAKIKGSFVETYSNIELNKTLAPDAFQAGSAAGSKLKPPRGTDESKKRRREQPQ